MEQKSFVALATLLESRLKKSILFCFLLDVRPIEQKYMYFELLASWRWPRWTKICCIDGFFTWKPIERKYFVLLATWHEIPLNSRGTHWTKIFSIIGHLTWNQLNKRILFCWLLNVKPIEQKSYVVLATWRETRWTKVFCYIGYSWRETHLKKSSIALVT